MRPLTRKPIAGAAGAGLGILIAVVSGAATVALTVGARGAGESARTRKTLPRRMNCPG